MTEQKGPGMTDRIPGMMERLDSLEKHTERLERIWQSSADDIKATIRSEIKELKEEQIADLRGSAKLVSERVERMADRISRCERKVDHWETGAGVINWLIRAFLAGSGLILGFFGANHLK